MQNKNGKIHWFWSQVFCYGALSSVLLFLVCAAFFFDWPFPFAPLGEEVISGKIRLSPADLIRYQTFIRTLLTMDNIYIVGMILGWLGIGVYVGERSRVIGILVMAIGIAGSVLDYTENFLMLGIIRNILTDAPFSINNWFYVWKLARISSFVVPYIAAILASIYIWKRKTVLDRIVSAVTVLVTIPAGIGLIFPVWEQVSDLWFLIWFLGAGVLLFAALPAKTIENK